MDERCVTYPFPYVRSHTWDRDKHWVGSKDSTHGCIVNEGTMICKTHSYFLRFFRSGSLGGDYFTLECNMGTEIGTMEIAASIAGELGPDGADDSLVGSAFVFDMDTMDSVSRRCCARPRPPGHCVFQMIGRMVHISNQQVDDEMVAVGLIPKQEYTDTRSFLSDLGYNEEGLSTSEHTFYGPVLEEMCKLPIDESMVVIRMMA